ncbi:hypothetical protein KUTeg_019878 [Tegillarca granosa]|uniref:FAD dependent oxidoreductase domain-containing protein n=1 Tax=Tegillarca granosa TaxID=220873 RepID=A0ABQ9EHS8_TEGGR|nr:hypothetical protein KUTeg_019878 [Tegillarca granosa]
MYPKSSNVMEIYIFKIAAKLTCGTTWHSAGMVGQAKDDVPTSKLIEYSRSLYKKFEAEGNHVGWKNCGSLMLAQTEDRFIHMQRKHSVAIATGVESYVISPEEVKQHCQMIRTDDLAVCMTTKSLNNCICKY